MVYTYTPVPPERLKLKRINLMRTAFILLLIGNSISIFTSLFSSIYSINIYLGNYWNYILVMMSMYSSGLNIISVLVVLTGNLLLLIVLVKMAQNGSPKLKRNCNTTFILLIIGVALSFLFSLILSSFVLLSYMYSYGIDIVLAIGSLVIIGINSSYYIFLGLTVRQLKTEHQVGNKPLVTTFIYPITFVLRLLIMFDIFSSFLVRLIVSLIISLLGLVILVVFFSEALVGLRKVKNALRVDLIQATSAPVIPPRSTKQFEISPTRKGSNFCIKCGAPLVPIAQFCGNCGHLIE